jgi:hypothetical protein
MDRFLTTRRWGIRGYATGGWTGPMNAWVDRSQCVISSDRKRFDFNGKANGRQRPARFFSLWEHQITFSWLEWNSTLVKKTIPCGDFKFKVWEVSERKDVQPAAISTLREPVVVKISLSVKMTALGGLCAEYIFLTVH